MTHGVVSSSLIWPPFPSLSHSWLDEFSLREVPCVLSRVQWQELVLWQRFPTPALLASWVSQPPCSQPHPELTNMCHPVLWASVQVPHPGADSAGHCICVTGKGEQGILVPSTGCWSQFSWVLFQTLEIFIKSSQIFWVFSFGYILDGSKLKTIVCNQKHIL